MSGPAPRLRLATDGDVPAIAALMERAIGRLQEAFLTPEQVAASRLAMGLDTQLVTDRTYLVAEENGVIVGCGGWSRRRTLYGGDAGTVARDASLLDPVTEAARIRAMYTDPAHVRRGIGRLILAACEERARAAGFRGAELMATLAGEPLYLACGYVAVERVARMAPTGPAVPGIRMAKPL